MIRVGLRAYTLFAVVVMAFGACRAQLCHGEDQPAAKPEPQGPPMTLNLNIPAPTLGGRQFWADVRYFHDWKIQQNLFTKHYRLLDGNDFRQAWGTLEQCETRLRQIRDERKLPEMSGEAVILVHGIGLSSKSLSSMQTYLKEQRFPHVFGFDYPSTRVDIQTSAEYLHQAVASLHGIKRVHFVTHSLGGLVVRQYLSKHDDPRIGRLVMLGTPNYGANLADVFRMTPPYCVILGPAGQQLGANADSYVWKLPVPRCEFAVIAGGRGDNAILPTGLTAGFNPFIPGDDDTMVSVQSALLEGAADSLVLPVLHVELPCNEAVKKHTARFLQEGRLRSRESGPRQPVIAAQRPAPVIKSSTAVSPQKTANASVRDSVIK